MKIVFFKRPKPRQFNYIPRYYNKEKEEREQRKKELGITNSDNAGDKLRAEIQRKWRYERQKSKSATSELKTVLYLVIIGLLIYLIFFTEFVNNFARLFTR